MKKAKNLFEIYPNNSQATNLSIAGGAARLLSILLLVAAAFLFLMVLLEGFRFASFGMYGNTLFYLLEEMDDELGMLFFSVAGAMLCGYASHVLRRKAEVLTKEESSTLEQ